MLGIRTVPVTWPVGQGADFSGVATLFSELDAGARRIVPELPAVDPKLRAHVADEIALVAHAGDSFDPARVLRGEQSDLLRRDTAEQMASRGPRAKVVEIKGVGHAPTLLHDDQIAIVRDFLRGS